MDQEEWVANETQKILTLFPSLPRATAEQQARVAYQRMMANREMRALREQRQAERDEEGFLDAAGEFGEGLALGGTRAVTSLGTGVGGVLDFLGADAIGQGIKNVSANIESGAEDIFTPEGRAGFAGELVGRIGGEIGTTIGTLGAGRALSLRYLPSLARNVKNLAAGSKLRSAGLATAAEMPLSIARAAGFAETEDSEFKKELAIEMLGSAAGGAFVGARSAIDDDAMDIAREIVDRKYLADVNVKPPGTKFPKSKPREGSRLLFGQGETSRLGRLQYLWNKVNTGLFDSERPLSLLGKKLAGLDGEARVHEAVHSMYGSAQGALYNLEQTMEPWIRENQKILKEISHAAAIRREMVLRAQSGGKAVRLDMPEADLAEMYTKIMQDSDLVQRTNELMGFARANLIRRKDAGILPVKEFNRITRSSKQRVLLSDGTPVDENFYVPMVPEDFAEKTAGLLSLERGKFVNVLKPSKGVDPILREKEPLSALRSPIDLTAFDTFATFDDIAMQRVGDVVTDLIEMAPNKELAGVIRRISKSKAEKLAKGRVFPHVRNGKQQFYEILDDDLFSALKQQAPDAASRYREIARGIATLKRNSITIVPDFAVAAVLRDWPLFAVDRAIQRGTKAAAETGAGAVTGATLGAATGDTPQERLERALQYGLAGTGAGILARPGTEIAQGVGMIARGAMARKNSNFIRNASPALADILGAMADNLGIDKTTWNEMVQRNGLTAGVGFGSADLNNAGTLIDRMMGQDAISKIIIPGGNLAKRGLKGALQGLRDIGIAAENAPRVAQYKAMMAQSKDALPGSGVIPAIYKAQEVTLPFARKGSWKAVRFINDITPFFGAQLQSYAKLIRLFRGDPKKSVAKGMAGSLTAMGAAITAPSISLWMTNKDDPAYWNRPLYERNLFWLIPDGEGEFYKVPKPFELGYVFGSIPERLLDSAAKKGYISSALEAGETYPRDADLISTLGDLSRNFATGAIPVPAAMEPLVNIGLNYDTFRMRELVPDYLETRPKETQARPSTSALSTDLSETMAQVSEFAADKVPFLEGRRFTMSPIKLDAVITSITGNSGRRAIDIYDSYLNVSGRAPTDRLTQEEKLQKLTGMARFKTQQYDIGSVEYQAYQVLSKAREARSEYLRMRRNNVDREYLRRFARRYEKEMMIAEATEDIFKKLQQIRRERNEYLGDQSLDQPERRALLDRQSERGLTAGMEAFFELNKLFEDPS